MNNRMILPILGMTTIFTHIRDDNVTDAELIESLSQRLRNNPEQYGWIYSTDSLFT